MAAVSPALSRQALPCAPQAKLLRWLVSTAVHGLGRAVHSWMHSACFSPEAQL